MANKLDLDSDAPIGSPEKEEVAPIYKDPGQWIGNQPPPKITKEGKKYEPNRK